MEILNKIPLTHNFLSNILLIIFFSSCKGPCIRTAESGRGCPQGTCFSLYPYALPQKGITTIHECLSFPIPTFVSIFANRFSIVSIQSETYLVTRSKGLILTKRTRLNRHLLCIRTSTLFPHAITWTIRIPQC